MTTGGTDIASWMRGRLFLAGVDDDTPVGTVLDVLSTVIVEVPKDQLTEWRRRFDRILTPIAAKAEKPLYDRETFGLLAEHQAGMRKLAGIPTTG